MPGYKKKERAPTKQEYVPTAVELAAMKAHLAKREATKPLPAIKASRRGKVTEISLDHPDECIAHVLLMEALGITDPKFLDGFLKQLVNVGSQGQELDEGGVNFVLSVVKGLEPKDHIEAMLAAQMAAVHLATMTFARRLAHVENIPQQDSAERAFNKLARTFAAQIEALKRYRTGGQQKVTVEHVTVNQGGQAIVGNVQQTAAPTKTAEGDSAPTPALSDQTGTAMEMEPVPAKARARVRRKN
jgi:hypothetical protein